MPTWVYPNLNDVLPAAPAGQRNAKWQHGDPYTDSQGRRVRDVSCNEPATGGVSVKTGDYTLQASDCGKFIVLDSASPHTFILPNPVPFPEWTAALICRGAGTLSVDANGLLLDGVGTSPVPTLTTGQGILVQTDGADYSSFAGKGAGGGGDVDVITRYLSPFFPGTPSNSQLMVQVQLPGVSVAFPMNFSGGGGTTEFPPTGTVTLVIAFLNSSRVVQASGSVTISPAGAFTYSLSAPYVSAPFDILTITNQVSADPTLGNVSFVIPFS
jgi:hypothetical protein